MRLREREGEGDIERRSERIGIDEVRERKKKRNEVGM